MKNIEKKADDKLLENKQKINKIDDEIDNLNNDKKKLDSIKESFININKSFDTCLNLLQYSIRGKKTNREIDEMASENTKSIANLTELIDEDKNKIQKKIDALYEEKEQIQKKKRED